MISVRDWGYRCELTLPQIELMQSDLPHTLYKNKNNKASKEDIDEAERAMMEALERKKKRMESKGLTIDEVFNGEADPEFED